MNRFRMFLIVIAMLCMLPAFAQQNNPANTENRALPSVDDHLRMLTQKLTLSAEQQQKARPILEQMQDEMQKVFDDKSLTHEEASARMRPVYTKADKQMRVFLSDEQKKRLDDLEQESHIDVSHNPGESASPEN